MPISLQVLITRIAISPRLATKILVNIDAANIVSIAQNIAYLRKAIAPIVFSAYSC